MAKTTITRALMRDLPSSPEGVTKSRIFDDRIPGFIAERWRNGTTFYLRYTDHRGRGREVKLGQARRQAEQLRAPVSLGADPVAERTRRRAVPTLADLPWSARPARVNPAKPNRLYRLTQCCAVRSGREASAATRASGTSCSRCGRSVW